MSDRLQALTVFVRVVDSGSFSRAGAELGLSQPSVSRIIGELEARLGVTLLERTTRKIALSDAGAAFLERARLVMHDLDAAEDAARGVETLSGTLRVVLPVAFGQRAVIPTLRSFLVRHPALNLDLVMSDEGHDLGGADVAIRVEAPDALGPGLESRRLATMTRHLVAAPVYLAGRAAPSTPEALAEHVAVFGPGPRRPWVFRRDDESVSVEPPARVQTSSGPAQFAAVQAGLGLGVLSNWIAAPAVRAGDLALLLPDWTLGSIEARAIYRADPHPSAKVKALVAHLAAALKAGDDRGKARAETAPTE